MQLLSKISLVNYSNITNRSLSLDNSKFLSSKSINLNSIYCYRREDSNISFANLILKLHFAMKYSLTQKVPLTLFAVTTEPCYSQNAVKKAYVLCHLREYIETRDEVDSIFIGLIFLSKAYFVIVYDVQQQKIFALYSFTWITECITTAGVIRIKIDIHFS